MFSQLEALLDGRFSNHHLRWRFFLWVEVLEKAHDEILTTIHHGQKRRAAAHCAPRVIGMVTICNADIQNEFFVQTINLPRQGKPRGLYPQGGL